MALPAADCLPTLSLGELLVYRAFNNGARLVQNKKLSCLIFQGLKVCKQVTKI